jgi:hypothetical protein
MKKLLTSLPAALVGMPLWAQAPGWVEDSLYRSGKINAVVVVVAVILVGLAVWMFRMDRRITAMERDRAKGS